MCAEIFVDMYVSLSIAVKKQCNGTHYRFIFKVAFGIYYLLEDDEVDAMAFRIHPSHQGVGLSAIFDKKCIKMLLQKHPQVKKRVRTGLALPVVERMVAKPQYQLTCVRKWVIKTLLIYGIKMNYSLALKENIIEDY